MHFYKEQHKFYCGIDLHARKMYLCILDEKGEVKLHQNINTDREVFLKAIEPFREDVVVAVECMFTWYWIADLCQREGIPFVLGHALYMRAIHEGNTRPHTEKESSRKEASRTFSPYPEYQQPVKPGGNLRVYHSCEE